MAMIFQLPGHQKKDREAERAVEIPSSSLPSVGAFLLKMNLQKTHKFLSLPLSQCNSYSTTSTSLTASNG